MLQLVKRHLEKVNLIPTYRRSSSQPMQTHEFADSANMEQGSVCEP